MFSTTNKTDNKHITASASSRKPLRVLSSFGDATTFSQTWTSFLPTTFAPDRPIKMRGMPFFSTVCGSSQHESLCNRGHRATYGNGLDPVFNSDVYRVYDISSASIKDVNLAMITSSDYGAVPVMEGNRMEPTCRERHVESLQSISCRKLEDGDALGDIVYDESIFLDIDGSVSSGYIREARLSTDTSGYSHYGPRHLRFQDFSSLVKDMSCHRSS